MADIDALFKGMATAPMFGRGNYMGEGVYVVDVAKLFVKPNCFKGFAGFIAEFTIVSSSNPKHVPGSTGSWFVKLALPNAFGDIKSMMFAILGRDPKEVAAEDVEAHNLAAAFARALCGSESAKAELSAVGVADAAAIAIGTRLRVECRQVKTKENKDFTRYNWSPAAPATSP